MQQDLPSWIQELEAGIRKTNRIDLVEASDDSADLFVSLNLDLCSLLKSLVYQRCERAIFLVEPRAVRPIQYSRRILGYFDYVYSPSFLYQIDSARETRTFHWSPWSPKDEPPENSLSTQEKFGVGMIAGDKYSFVTGQQYELRRKIIESWSGGAAFPLSVAGTGWANGKLKILTTIILEAVRSAAAGFAPKGVIESLRRRFAICHNEAVSGDFNGHQVDYLRQFEFAIVIENEASIVTEKLWQAVEAGCVPLYIGPNLTEFGLPEEMALKFDSAEDLLAFDLRLLHETQRGLILATGAAQLQNSDRWTYGNSVAGIVENIQSLLIAKKS